METKPYDGDVLEHALNFGVADSARVYELSTEYVYNLVADFHLQIENEWRCLCEISSDEGQVVMCFMCTGPVGKRLKM